MTLALVAIVSTLIASLWFIPAFRQFEKLANTEEAWSNLRITREVALAFGLLAMPGAISIGVLVIVGPCLS